MELPTQEQTEAIYQRRLKLQRDRNRAMKMKPIWRGIRKVGCQIVIIANALLAVSFFNFAGFKFSAACALAVGMITGYVAKRISEDENF